MPFSETYVLTPDGSKKLSRLQQKSFRAISKVDIVDLYILTSLSEGEYSVQDLEKISPVDQKILQSRVRKLRTGGDIDWADNRRGIW